MKKAAAVFLAAAIPLSLFLPACAAENQTTPGAGAVSFKAENALYAHGTPSKDDNEAWTMWQCEHNDDLVEVNTNKKYFFLPSGASDKEIELYNGGSGIAEIGGQEIAAGETATFSYEEGKTYDVDFGGKKLELTFLRSTAEAAIYVNSSDADGRGTDLMTYLFAAKSNTAAATGAIVDKDGSVDNTAIKKIKGRGNTTWGKSKKPFNITYDSKVSIAGMTKSKKYSMLANYQDDSLSRNRFLYDLSDAVGMPYASDSRYVDFYVNGYYWGSYQLTEKIEVGSSNVVNDFEETDYLNNDLTVKEDFPFVCEIDPSAGSDDFTVNCSNNIQLTIKSPDLASDDPGYSEVKKYVKNKFNEFIIACTPQNNKVLSDYADIDSLTKIYLINELGKNWDAGVSSLYFTYKQSPDGIYRFYGSPVWDYDNSLGNANGVEGDLRNFGVTDYTKYTGWWCMYKGRRKGASMSNNIMSCLATNDYVLEAAPKIWFEDFVPALRHFSGEQYSEEIDKELYTAEEYREIVKGSAEMNYRSGWLLNTGSWIADHSKLEKASFDYASGKYSTDGKNTSYAQTFDGMYDYSVDWMNSRAAWLSAQMYEDYNKSGGLIGDVNDDGFVDSQDALELLRSSLDLSELPEYVLPRADVNSDGAIDSLDALAVLRHSVGIVDEGSVVGKEV